MSSEIAIAVENLSKCYMIYDTPRDRLKQFIYPRIQRAVAPLKHLITRRPVQVRDYYKEFWALKNVSFEVKKGEAVGIIGRNGSGKSTLLQMICGTLTPSGGTIRTQGRIAALLELGSGFNPDFTGRENVYMNAAVLGLSNDEINARFDDIASFADIGDFIEQPVKTYSSGMAVRLAFAVQAQISPEILIVDEALAVGDAKFQAKCFERLRQLKESGTSILLVTHSTDQIVTHCSNAILLEYGRILEFGEPRNVVNRYLDLLFGKKRSPSTIDDNARGRIRVDGAKGEREELLSDSEDIFATRPGYNRFEYRWGDRSAAILDYFLSADEELFPSAVSVGQRVTIGISIAFYKELVRPILGMTIKTKEGITVCGVNSETLDFTEFASLGRSGSVVRASAAFICRLAAGDYFVSLGIATRNGEEIVPHDRRYDSIHIQVRPDTRFFGIVDLSCSFSEDVTLR